MILRIMSQTIHQLHCALQLSNRKTFLQNWLKQCPKTLSISNLPHNSSDHEHRIDLVSLCSSPFCFRQEPDRTDSSHGSKSKPVSSSKSQEPLEFPIALTYSGDELFLNVL